MLAFFVSVNGSLAVRLSPMPYTGRTDHCVVLVCR
jgi:hypothetical protein